MHEFTVYNGDDPLATLVCSSESFEYEYEIPMILETEKRLNDYIPQYSRIMYAYNFGDPNHPEYQDMLSWGRMQHYKDFNLEFVNRRLKTALRGVWER